MKTKALIIILILALVTMIVSSIEIYRSEWNTNHTVTSVTTNPIDGQDYTISWGSMILAPLKSSLVGEKHSQAFSLALQEQISGIGLGALMAPREISPIDVTLTGRVALLVSLQEYKLSRTITGWRVEGSARAESIRLASTPLEREIRMAIDIQTKGTMRGWVKRGTAEKQLLERMAHAIAKGMRDELVNKGMNLPSALRPSAESSSGLSWWFGFAGLPKLTPDSHPSVEHPLLVPQATVDYFWTTADTTVLVYRVKTTGSDLEQQLLSSIEELGYQLDFGYFVDSVDNRRKLMAAGEAEITHWDTAATGSSAFSPWERHNNRRNESVERYVLVVLQKRR